MFRLSRPTASVELREANGRTISGVVLDFQDQSPTHKERFAGPGSITFGTCTAINLEHRIREAVAWSPGGGARFSVDDEAVRVHADLPEIPAADEALRMIREAGGSLGLSVEFYCVRDRHENGIRIIEEAELLGVAITPKPSYPRSRVEARDRHVDRLISWL